MSEIYEGFVTAAPEARLRDAIAKSGTTLRFRVSSIGPYAVADRIADREDSFSPELLDLAMSLSSALGPLVTYLYDSRVAYRAGAVFNAGVETHVFGEADELWVPLDEDGEPLLDAAPLHLPALRDDEEYETSMNAIDLALAEITGGSLDWRTVRDHVSEVDEFDG